MVHSGYGTLRDRDSIEIADAMYMCKSHNMHRGDLSELGQPEKSAELGETFDW